jgi:hypothetical protein
MKQPASPIGATFEERSKAVRDAIICVDLHPVKWGSAMQLNQSALDLSIFIDHLVVFCDRYRKVLCNHCEVSHADRNFWRLVAHEYDTESVRGLSTAREQSALAKSAY